MSRTAPELLTEALAHLERIHEYTTQDLSKQLVIDAICMRLSAAVETLSRLEPAVRDSLFGEQWPLMWGMRNRIAHGYLLIDAAIIRRTLETDLPSIEAAIRQGL